VVDNRTEGSPTWEVFDGQGRSYTLAKGDRLRSGHPLVKDRPELFAKEG
jgi:hypothetical protein